MLGRFSRRYLGYDLKPLIARLDGKQYVNGKLMAPISGKYFDAHSPATRERIASVPASNEQDVDLAVKGAVAAQKEWRKLTGRQRGALLTKCGQKISENIEEFAQLCALETGKAIRTEARVEAGILADAFHFFGGLGGEMKGETIPWSHTSLTYTVREPYGVVGGKNERYASRDLYFFLVLLYMFI
jgi:acyl-CoA reductase-like NAD-dependent aldehyde dehydrogenase